MIDVPKTAKGTADEAAKIATKEATTSKAEETRKVAGGTHGAPSNTSAPVSTGVEMGEASSHAILPTVSITSIGASSSAAAI